jgi:hypothetical protein
LLRDANIAQIFSKLKELLQFLDYNLQSKIKEMVDDFAFTNKFYEKYIEIWQSINFT